MKPHQPTISNQELAHRLQQKLEIVHKAFLSFSAQISPKCSIPKSNKKRSKRNHVDYTQTGRLEEIFYHDLFPSVKKIMSLLKESTQLPKLSLIDCPERTTTYKAFSANERPKFRIIKPLDIKNGRRNPLNEEINLIDYNSKNRLFEQNNSPKLKNESLFELSPNKMAFRANYCLDYCYLPQDNQIISTKQPLLSELEMDQNKKHYYSSCLEKSNTFATPLEFDQTPDFFTDFYAKNIGN